MKTLIKLPNSDMYVDWKAVVMLEEDGSNKTKFWLEGIKDDQKVEAPIAEVMAALGFKPQLEV